MNQTDHDRYLEDSHMMDVEDRARKFAIAEVANRGTTFTALRAQVEEQMGRPCDVHGLDFHEYRVRFRYTVEDIDLGDVVMIKDFVFDFTRFDRGWVEMLPVAENPAIQELRERL